MTQHKETLPEGAEPQAEQKPAVVVQPLPATPKAGRQVISEFQPDAIELEERTPPRVARITLYTITALILAGVTWASLASIDEVVVARGKLVTTKPTIVVQPIETSIVRSIDVQPGDVVKAGQTLATLDATFSQADVDRRRTEYDALDAQVKRMEAELQGRDYAAEAGNTPDEQLQMQVFMQRKAFHDAQMQNFDQQIAGQQAAIESSADQQVILAERQQTLTQIEVAREKLAKQETGSLMNMLTSRDARLAVDASYAQAVGTAATARHAVAKLQADKQAFIEDFRRVTMETLADKRSQRDSTGEEMKKMELRRDMVKLTAPSDAVVLDLAQRSIGSVVREAEPVLTLVPLNVPLEAEVTINAGDIGRVSSNADARIKFDAFPFQKFGTAEGSVRTISHDAYSHDNSANASVNGGSAGDAEGAGAPYYKARIRLDKTDLRTPVEDVRLLPGMAVTAELKVGQRKVISYFLYPILKGLDTAIREP
ncbi:MULTISPECIES: HlyD family type I secretion periplasmic adaptor subunit [Mesorhizobium]|uniref:Membrane fusion protein (MFP) family protein n=1 Tax=Mesorhizobium denitrificans TaxID=2294114 RepID=A0A371XHH0_9HYPH|nr:MULTISPECIES: HlyD family type I secretion periplasmic adaptor subunit [Mesorhizobium]RFC68695.1 HlyD family type I secretion periplasmic adaptor subunit [Mesorhizobium denitrificans]